MKIGKFMLSEIKVSDKIRQLIEEVINLTEKVNSGEGIYKYHLAHVKDDLKLYMNDTNQGDWWTLYKISLTENNDFQLKILLGGVLAYLDKKQTKRGE